MRSKHKFDCDVLVLGLGPAGMACSIFAQSMGLHVIAIEPRKIGGECLNVGCIPSKALLKAAKLRHQVMSFPSMGLQALPLPLAIDPFKRVRAVVSAVNEGKTAKMFESIDLILDKGPAHFVDSHTVEVPGFRAVRARKIFICTGTSPAIPPIQGLSTVKVLTNENLYELPEVPKSTIVIGGGAIGCEMGQALARLGSKVTILNYDPYLLPRGDREAGDLLASEFKKEGIRVVNNARFEKVESLEDGAEVFCSSGEIFFGEKILVAAGRTFNIDLNLETAGIEYDLKKGIYVRSTLQTSQNHVYAVGDCNGYRLFTHAAMHQGMIAVMNSMLPSFFRYNFKKYVVPWSVFTEPEVSEVGLTENELRAQGIKYQMVRTEYADYGRTTADGFEAGFIKAFISQTGKVLGVTIVGEQSSEMIQEWSLIIQKRLPLTEVLFLQHSFPTYSFMNKRIAERWLMKRVESRWIQRLAKVLFRLF